MEAALYSDDDIPPQLRELLHSTFVPHEPVAGTNGDVIRGDGD